MALSMDAFQNEMRRLAKESTSAHFNAQFNARDLQEGERAVYDWFTTMDWLNGDHQLTLMDAIKQNESQVLNTSQKAFYHYIRNVIQVKLMENLS